MSKVLRSLLNSGVSVRPSVTQLNIIACNLFYSLSESEFWISFSESVTSNIAEYQNVNIIRNSKGHISLLLEATVTRFGMLIVLYVLCVLIWPWPDPRSMSRSRCFWLSENCIFPQVYLHLHNRSLPPLAAAAITVNPFCGYFCIWNWLFVNF